MRHNWEKHYEALISSHEDCIRLYKAHLERLECCFLESFQYTQQLVIETIEKGFESVDEEIHFFKEVKPKFAAQMIFYGLLYHDSLFEPKEDIKGRVEFWQRQGERLKKYASKNEVLYEYWKSGCKEKDSEYFTKQARKQELIETISVSNILWQIKEEAENSPDKHVANFIALEKYEQYVKGKLAAIYSQES